MKGPDTRPLSQALSASLDGLQFTAAAFLTYAFEPEFFERHVLPLLFDRALSPTPNIRLLQLAEALRAAGPVEVFYDRAALSTEGGPATLDYQPTGVSHRRGAFHPKNVFILAESTASDGSTRDSRLIVLTTSANLTRGGWWTNVEVAHVHVIHAGEPDPLRDDLLGPGHAHGLLQRLRKLDRTGVPHPALDLIEDFLRRRVPRTPKARRAGASRPRLYTGREPFPEFVREHARLGPGPWCLEIISPYFENTASASTIKTLVDTLGAETRIFLPRDSEGRANCLRAFHETVTNLPEVSWAKLPAPLTHWSKQHKDSNDRFVHAKVYRLFSPAQKREILVIGSVNLTGAAHRGADRGNVETAILVEVPKLSDKPDWWMDRMLDGRAEQFAPIASEDTPPAVRIYPVSLRFDWVSGLLEYFWEGGRALPTCAEIHVAGQSRATIPAPAADSWQPVPIWSELLRELFRSTSYAELVVADGPPQRVLVRQLGIEDRPSLLRDLTPSEILEYWSLLTPEQRDAFLGVRLAALTRLAGLSDEEAASLSMPADDASHLFDQFAGIFHALSCFRERVAIALETPDRRGEKAARHLLLGKRQYDSLPSYVDKLLEASAADDPVATYVSLLCCRQALDAVVHDHPEFVARHTKRLAEIRKVLDDAGSQRARIAFPDALQASEFFDWFEPMFLAEQRS